MTDDNPQLKAPLGEVFISYSWDNEHHVEAVLTLSNRLRSEGIDCVLDQYEQSPPEGWPRWMDRKIRDARLVISICTENYYKRLMGDDHPDTGTGVRWEGGLIYQHMYNAGANHKFIPVLFRKENKTYIPTPLQSATYYVLDADYDKLYARLLNRPGVPKPELGSVRPLPEREVRTNLSLYVTSPINVDLWNAAQWRGTFMGFFPEGGPPILGFAFLNEKPARQIFEEWHKRYGERDKFEELRISIVEGDVKGELPGYTVHVGIDIENTLKRYEDAGLVVDEKSSMFMMISRLNRMNPAPGSNNLEMFKQLYRHEKTYLLVPAVLKPDGSQATPLFELGIFKNTIHFRHVDEIGLNDLDSVVLGSGRVKRNATGFGPRPKRKRKGK
jgi:SEFIR domain-containing protein